MGIIIMPLLIIFIIIELKILTNTLWEFAPARLKGADEPRKIKNIEYTFLIVSAIIVPSLIILGILFLSTQTNAAESNGCIQPLNVNFYYIIFVTPLLTAISIMLKRLGDKKYKLLYLGLANAAFMYPPVLLLFGESVVNTFSAVFYNGVFRSCFIP